MNYVSYSDLSKDIRANLHILQSYKFDLVVGLPRSGIVPANIIALFLNIHCTDLLSFIKNNELKTGSTRNSKNASLIFPHSASKILIVDDSIFSGNSLKSDLGLVPDKLLSRITTCAIYSSDTSRSDIDITLRTISSPRMFEWNMFHHPLLTVSCLDIDGVLCQDPSEKQNDDGPLYKEFLLNAPPLFLPTLKVNALVTSRLEKYREQTETWLKKHNIKYDKLIMLNLRNKEERQKLAIHAKHKAEFYLASKCELFIESDYNQSIEIANLTGKAVYCVDMNVMLKANMKQVIKQNSKRQIKALAVKLLPQKLVVFLKKTVQK